MKNFILITSLIMVSCSVSNEDSSQPKPSKTFFEANHGTYADAEGVLDNYSFPDTGNKIGEIYYRIYPYQFADVYTWTRGSCYKHSTTTFSDWVVDENNSKRVTWVYDCRPGPWVRCAFMGISRRTGYPSCPTCNLRYYYVPEDDPLGWSNRGWSRNYKPADIDVDTLRICGK